MQIHVLTDFNHNPNLIHYLSYNFQRCIGKLKLKAETGHINGSGGISNKRVSDKVLFIMLFSSIRAYLLFVLLISFHILFLYSLEKKSPPNELTQISPPKKLPLLEEKIPTPQHLSELVNNNKNLNLNIAAYFLNVLGSPDESTWSTIGGPINKTIEHLRPSRHHQKTIKRIWRMVSKCKEMKTEYTGNNYNSGSHS